MHAAEIDSISRKLNDQEREVNIEPTAPISLWDRYTKDRHAAHPGRGIFRDADTTSSDESHEEDRSKHKRRDIRVGERSVYGTEESVQALYHLPSALLDSEQSQSEDQVPPSDEFSGDTLVTSEARQFLGFHTASRTLSVPRKRASPGKEPKPPRSPVQDSHEGTFDEGAFIGQFCPSTDPEILERYPQLGVTVLSEADSNESDGSVLIRPAKRKADEALTLQHDSRRTLEAPVDAEPSKRTCSTSPKKDKPNDSPGITQMQGQSTETQRYSPYGKYASPDWKRRKHTRRSLDVSIYRSPSPHLLKGTPRACRHGFKACGPRPSAERQNSEVPNRKVGVALPAEFTQSSHDGSVFEDATAQQIEPRRPDTPMPQRKLLSIPCPNSHQNSPLESPKHPFNDHSPENYTFRSQHLASPTPNKMSRIPGRLHSHRTERPKPWAAPLELHYEDFTPTIKFTVSETQDQHSPQEKRIPTSPCMRDLPWRRDLDSNRYFPEGDMSQKQVTPTTRPGKEPMREPFWINFEGKLIICFPNHVKPGFYEIVVLAKVQLSQTDIDGWRTFRIPGLPCLDTCQQAGGMTFSIEDAHEYYFERGSMEQFRQFSPNLAAGTSRFGPVPLLRLRDQVKACDTQSEEEISLGRRWSLIKNLSLDDGTPDKDLVLWLLDTIGRASAEHFISGPFDSWFSRLNAAELRSTLELILPDDRDYHSSCYGAQPSTTQPYGQVQTDSWDINGRRVYQDYFASLASKSDPLQPEDLSTLAWNFELSVTRNLEGRLQCRLTLEIVPGSPPFLVVDARDWLPNFATIDGNLATRRQWWETEEGNLALHHMESPATRGSAKIDLHFQELVVDDDPAAGRSTTFIRLPNVVDKSILGGWIICNTPDTTIIYDEPNCEDITWRNDHLSGRYAVALPKLQQGYRMFLTICDEEAEEDDLATLPDIDEALDMQTQIPQVGNPVRQSPQRRQMSTARPRLPVIQEEGSPIPAPTSPTIQNTVSLDGSLDASTLVEPIPPWWRRYLPKFPRRITPCCAFWLSIICFLIILIPILTVGIWGQNHGAQPSLKYKRNDVEDGKHESPSLEGIRWLEEVGSQSQQEPTVLEEVLDIVMAGANTLREGQEEYTRSRDGKKRSIRDVIDRALGWHEIRP